MSTWIEIEDKNVDEILSYLKTIRNVLYLCEGRNAKDFAPEILTICDFIKQIEDEKELPH